ncbi:histidine acid phosphatase [Xylariales sp. PMI_506]|nr:histidine acid phosphatase [Xylariales sp. PMI_506]
MAIKFGLVSLLATLPAATAETVLGVFIFHRHGDRTSKSTPPTNLTSLGADQVFQAGTYFRNKYVAADSSSPIYGLSHDIAVNSELSFTSTVDTVLQSSAMVFTQGLYPPAGTLAVDHLANGSIVESPLGGYQYIPVNIVSSPSSTSNSENSAWLQGSSGCANAVLSSNNYLLSSEYLTALNQTQSFYQGLLPVINSTFSTSQATFKNAYTIFDYINVANIHNTSIPSDDLLTNDTKTELFTLASEHEWGLAYNQSDPIRAVAGAVLAGQIVQQLNNTLHGKSALPFAAQFGAYGTFMSFFGLAQLQNASPIFMNIVDYASAITFELIATSNDTISASNYPSTADVSVRFLFNNASASDANPPVAYPLFGQNETLIPWTTFVSEMGKFAISDTADWCTACGNTTGVCADTSASSGGSSSSSGSSNTSSTSGGGMSLAVAGVIGALVTLVVVLGVEGLVYAAAGLKLVKKSTLAAAAPASGAAVATAKA